MEDITQLAKIAESEPQAAYAAYIFGLSHRWTYYMRTIEGTKEFLQPVEDAITNLLIPAILGRRISPEDREIISLPVRWGGMGVNNLVESADSEYNKSLEITEPLVELIKAQKLSLLELDLEKVAKLKAKIRSMKDFHYKLKFEKIMSTATDATKRALQMASEKGASSWLTSLPLELYGFVLNKREFRDGICLRYNWNITDIPSYCACGQRNNIDHTLICKKGGYVSMRHNQLRDIEADLLREVCKDVRTEPELIPLETEDLGRRGNTADKARLDISARGVWSPMERAFFDVRVTHPNAPSNRQKTLEQIYKAHEQEKKALYNERVLQVEKGCFTPLVFTTSGGMANECQKFNKRLAQLISRKRNESYADTICYIRKRLRFALLKSTLIALRGARGENAKIQSMEFSDICFNLIPGSATETGARQ